MDKWFVVSEKGEMRSAKDLDNVIDIVGEIATDRCNTFRIARIFRVNEFGDVTFYDIEYKNFKLNIVPIPKHKEEN